MVDLNTYKITQTLLLKRSSLLVFLSGSAVLSSGRCLSGAKYYQHLRGRQPGTVWAASQVLMSDVHLYFLLVFKFNGRAAQPPQCHSH